MSLVVTVVSVHNTPIEAGVSLQLLSAGAVVAIATTDANGRVTFDVDPDNLLTPAINLAPRSAEDFLHDP